MQDDQEVKADPVAAEYKDTVAGLRELLKEIEAVLAFAIEDGFLSENDVLGLCVDPHGLLRDVRASIVELCDDEGCPHHGKPHVCVSAEQEPVNE